MGDVIERARGRDGEAGDVPGMIEQLLAGMLERLASLGAEFTDEAVAGATRYAALLSGEAAGLSRAMREPGGVVAQIEDALGVIEAAAEFGLRGPSADIGSGAGLPGLAVALFSLELAPVTLVERSSQRCAFLRRAAIQTGAKVQVVDVSDRGRAVVSGKEAVEGSRGSAVPATEQTDASVGGSDGAPPARFSLVMAKALAPPAQALRIASEYRAPAGTIAIWMGSAEDRDRWRELEVAAAGSGLLVAKFRPQVLETLGALAIIRESG